MCVCVCVTEQSGFKASFYMPPSIVRSFPRYYRCSPAGDCSNLSAAVATRTYCTWSWIFQHWNLFSLLHFSTLLHMHHVARSLLQANASNRVCNALALLQCVASHNDTRSLFLHGSLSIYIYIIHAHTHTHSLSHSRKLIKIDIVCLRPPIAYTPLSYTFPFVEMSFITGSRDMSLKSMYYFFTRP